MKTLAKDFKIRASKAHDIATEVGLTENEQSKLTEYSKRKAGEGKPLTANMEKELERLIYKRDNPELPQGAKTYAKKWLKEKKYKRRKQVDNKYTNKGNFNEIGESLELVSRYFKVDLTPYHNTAYASNDHSEGTCDIEHPTIGIIDIKNSWDLFTFPMFETEIPKTDIKYIDQVNVYQDIYKNYNKAHVAYTLTDCPLHLLEDELKWLRDDNEKQKKANELIYTFKSWFEAKEKLFPNAEPFDFTEIPQKDRIKVFSFDWDEDKAKKRKERVEQIRNFIEELLTI